MDFHSALGLSLPIGLGIAALGSGIGLGIAVAAALQAISRQPEIFGKAFLVMLIGAAFIESVTIYALVIVFMLMGKIG